MDFFPKHEIDAAGGDEESRITGRPRLGRETAAGQRAYPREMCVILSLTAERNIRHDRPRYPKETSAATHRECPRGQAHGGGDYHSDKGSGKRESSGAGRPSYGTAKTRTSARSEHPARAPPSYRLHWHEKTFRSNGRTWSLPYLQEGRQDDVRKQPWHLARATRG
ncbi:unnamed protein product [Ascophyllum nodosum]